MSPHFNSTVRGNEFANINVSRRQGDEGINFSAQLPPLLALLFGSFRTQLCLRSTVARRAAINFRLNFAQAARACPTFLSFGINPTARRTHDRVTRLHRLGLRLALVNAHALNRGVWGGTNTISGAALTRALRIALLHQTRNVIGGGSQDAHHFSDFHGFGYFAFACGVL